MKLNCTRNTQTYCYLFIFLLKLIDRELLHTYKEVNKDELNHKFAVQKSQKFIFFIANLQLLLSFNAINILHILITIMNGQPITGTNT